MNNIIKPLSFVATPLIAILASCATTTNSEPRAHRHGNLVHSHALTAEQGTDHQHKTVGLKPKTTTVKIAKKKVVVPVKPARPADIKPLGIKAIGHKHHTHLEPKTGVESVPC